MLTAEKSIEATGSFAMYPNPAQTILNIKSAKAFDHLSVYDVQGRLILSKGDISSDHTSLDIRHLQEGVYILEAISEDRQSHRKRIFVTH